MPDAETPPRATGGNLLPGEDEKDRSERQLTELMTEVRVAMPGVQVLFAFLLAVPFQARFGEVSSTEKALFVVTLLSSGLASACFIALPAFHRVLFRHQQREFIIVVGNRLAVAALAALGVAMSCAGALTVSFVYSATAGWVTLGCGVVLFFGLWFAVPLKRLRRDESR
jgi:hypothetical protein